MRSTRTRAALATKVADGKARSWAQLHNRMDSMDNNDNPGMPTLQPWVATTAMPANRFVFKRNPFFHRVDSGGAAAALYRRASRSSIADAGLIAAKTAAGDADLQARGLSLADITVLKANEAQGQVQGFDLADRQGIACCALSEFERERCGLAQADARAAIPARAGARHQSRATSTGRCFSGLASEGNNAVLEGVAVVQAGVFDRECGLRSEGGERVARSNRA